VIPRLEPVHKCTMNTVFDREDMHHNLGELRIFLVEPARVGLPDTVLCAAHV